MSFKKYFNLQYYCFFFYYYYKQTNAAHTKRIQAFEDLLPQPAQSDVDCTIKKQESINISTKNSYDQNQNAPNFKKFGSMSSTGCTPIQVNNNKKPSDNISFAFSEDVLDADSIKKDDIDSEKKNVIDNDKETYNRKNNEKTEKTDTAADSDADFYSFFENVSKNGPWIDSDVVTHASASAKLLRTVFGEPSRTMDYADDNKPSLQSVGE